MGERSRQLCLEVYGAAVRLPPEVQAETAHAMARLLRQVLHANGRPALPAGGSRKGEHDDAGS